MKGVHAMEAKKTKKIIMGAAVFLILAAVLGIAYFQLRPKTEKGAKKVEITVIDKSGKETIYEIDTDAEYLKEAMEDAKEEGLTFSGEESEYGLMIDRVNGEKASYEDGGAYWGFSVNGEYCNFGVSEQPVKDGDEFEVRYTVGE